MCLKILRKILYYQLAIEYLPVPSVVSFIQIITSAVAILIYKFLCGGNAVDGFEWSKMKAYSMYIVAFVAAIYANMQALANSNVETVIVFRACSPISVTIVEYFLMDRGNYISKFLKLYRWPSIFIFHNK